MKNLYVFHLDRGLENEIDPMWTCGSSFGGFPHPVGRLAMVSIPKSSK